MTRPLSTPARKKLVISALEDIKARDILAVDVHKITTAFDWIVVATAESARQTKALARHVSDKLREKGCTIIGIEGEDSGEWILVDAGDIVAHIMQPAVRTYYNLEELWGEGRSDPVVNSTERTPEPIPELGSEPPVPVRKRKAPVRRAAKPVAKPAPRARAKPAPKPRVKPVAKPKAKTAAKHKAKTAATRKRAKH
jgi:ribosome-associated protein